LGIRAHDPCPPIVADRPISGSTLPAPHSPAASPPTNAIVQKVGRIVEQTVGIDIEGMDAPENPAQGRKDSRLYKILSARAELSAAEIDAFGKTIQNTVSPNRRR
jgi:hypothetical protein